MTHLFVVSVVLLRLGSTGLAAKVEIVGISLILCSLMGEVVHRLIELPLLKVFRGKRVPGINTLPT